MRQRSIERVDRVYRYGCTRRECSDEKLALQLLGQASNYREDLRRVYNRQARDLRELVRLGKSDEHAHVMAFLYDRKRAEIREARARRGHLLDAGTYWLVEDAVEQAAKANKLDPIRVQRWDQTGRIGAAIQSVEKFPADAWVHKRVGLGPPDDRRTRDLTILVGSLSDRRPITWRMMMHRPLPKDTVVKRVAVQRVRSGHRFRWEVLITASFEQLERPEDAKACGVVGVDVGWRRLSEDRQRVAVHQGADGESGELVVDVLEAFEYADGVRSVRDRVFDDAKAYAQRAELDPHAYLWRDKERMRRLAAKSDDLGPRWWQRVDRHLEDIECGVRTRATRRRLDAFRTYADQLARRYRFVALEDMAMTSWVGEGDTHARERRRSTAAVSLLQTAIAERFGPERVDWVPAFDTSRRCSDCGEVCSEGIGPVLEWTCTSCGVVHDQDLNAAVNIRALSERWIDDGGPVRARSRKVSTRKEIRRGDAIATGTREGMTVTPRKPVSKAAE